MKITAIFVFLTTFYGLVSARDTRLLEESHRLRALAAQLMDNLASGPRALPADEAALIQSIGDQISDPEKRLDAWIRGFSAPVAGRTDPYEIAERMNGLYRRLNPESTRFGADVDPLLMAAFLSIVDRLDGTLDVQLWAPNIDRFFQLAMVEQVPLASICLSCRVENDWTDVRTLIDSNRLVDNLPKKLIKELHRKKSSNREKLITLTRFLAEMVRYNSDGYQNDFWQTPFETLLLENGDCEDYALLFQTIAEQFDIPTQMVVGMIMMPREDGSMARIAHAWIEYDGVIFDPSRRDGKQAAYLANIRFDSRNARFTHEEKPIASENHVVAIK